METHSDDEFKSFFAKGVLEGVENIDLSDFTFF